MDTEELQGMMVEALVSLRDLSVVNSKADDLLKSQIDLLWEAHEALSHRVESLTRLTLVKGDAA